MIKKMLSVPLLGVCLLTNAMAAELPRTVLPYTIPANQEGVYQLSESSHVYWVGVSNSNASNLGVYEYDGSNSIVLTESASEKEDLLINNAGHAVWREWTDTNQTGNHLQNGRVYFYDGNVVTAVSPEGKTYVLHALGENGEVVMSGYNELDDTWTLYLYNGTTTIDIGLGSSYLDGMVQINSQGQVAWLAPQGANLLSNALFYFDGQTTHKLADIEGINQFKLNDLGQVAWSFNDFTAKSFQFNVYMNGQIINVVSSSTQNVDSFDLNNNGEAFWVLEAPWGGDVNQLFVYANNQIIALSEGTSRYEASLSEGGHILYSQDNSKLVFASAELGIKTILDGQYNINGTTLLDDGSFFVDLQSTQGNLLGHYTPATSVFLPINFPELGIWEFFMTNTAVTQNHLYARFSTEQLNLFNGNSVFNVSPEFGTAFVPRNVMLNEAGDVLVQEMGSNNQLVLYKLPLQ